MKIIAIILGVLGFSFSALAQDGNNNVKRNDLKGPAYKNYKVWKDKSAPTVLYSASEKETLTGPAYKNQQAKSNVPSEKLVAVVTGSERQKLTGPAYKNYGSWTKKTK